MPKAGVIGLRLTPQRKMVLSEMMESEGFAKPTEAIDYALALAQDYVKYDPDAVSDTELPDFVNYYVGETDGIANEGAESTGALVNRERVDAMVSSLKWRSAALAFIRNCEPTIVNVADAVDFALLAYLMHNRAGDISEERRSEIREQLKRNAVAFKEELRDFRVDNMNDARTKKGTDTPKKKKTKPGKLSDIANAIAVAEHKIDGYCEACAMFKTIGIVDEQRKKLHDANTHTVRYFDPKTGATVTPSNAQAARDEDGISF